MDKMGSKKLAFGVISLMTGCYIIWVWLNCYPGSVKEIHQSIRYSGNCNKKMSIFFLKTHKCGSSTIQNIFMRFGKRYNLNFVLPDTANYVGNPEKFSRDLIGESLALGNQEKYDIFTHHTRYYHRAVKEVMKEGAPFVTILREPVQLQQSLYEYYELFIIYKMPLKQLLSYSLSDLRSIPRAWNKLGWNQMAWDLGVSIQEIRSPKTIGPLIEQVEEEFDLVMIMEFAEASLVLLADLMCWPLEDVRFFKLNAKSPMQKKNATKVPLTKKEISKLEELNVIDVHLYEHFRKRLKERIVNYGVEKMVSQVKRLVALNEEMFSKCVDGITGKNIQRYVLKSNASSECEDFVKSELQFTAELQAKQRNKVEVLKKLRTFLEQG